MHWDYVRESGIQGWERSDKSVRTVFGGKQDTTQDTIAQMASVQAERDPVVVERIQQLIGAIHVMHKMVGDKSQPWIAETASSAGVSGSEAATSVFHAALTNLNDVSTKCTCLARAVEHLFCWASKEVPFSGPNR